MEDFIQSLFGSAPDYSSVMTPEQTQQMSKNALAQGGIQALVALLGATGQQPRPVGTGQALAGALGAGYGGYQQSFDNTLKQMLTSQQLGEYKQKQDARAKYEQAIKGATTMTPQSVPMAQGQGSQFEMLSRPEFGGDMAVPETLGALRGNLPMMETVDPTAANRAALDYLRQSDPAKFIELTTPKTDSTAGNVGQYKEALRLGFIPKDTSLPSFVKMMEKQPLISMPGAETEYSKIVGKTKGEKDYATFDIAQKAASNLPKINSTLTELETSDVITGLGSEVFKNIERAKSTFLADQKAGKKVTDTEYVDALLGSDIFPMISSLGIGAKGLDTPAEREFLRQVMTGTTSMNKNTLIKLTKTRKDIEERAINKYNERVERGDLDRFFNQTGERKELISIPSAGGLPPGVTVRKRGG